MKKSIMLLSLLSVLAFTSCSGNVQTPDTPDTGLEDGDDNPGTDEETPGTDEGTPDTDGDGDDTPVAPKELTQETLDELAKGYILESKVTEDINGKVDYFYSDSYHDGDSFTVKAFKSDATNPTKDEEVLFETYSADSDGYLVAERRTLSNEKTYLKVYNPATSDYSKFATGYTNFFTTLKLEDFDAKDGVYTLKDTSLSKVSPFIITQLYGNEGFELDSLTVTYVEDVLTLKTVAKPFLGNGIIYNYTFETVVVDSGEDVSFAKRADPYEEVSDEKFSSMITALKAHNFKLVQQNYYDDTLDSTSTLIVDGDLTYRENEFDGESYKIATYKDGDKYFEANNKDGTFVKSGEVDAETFSALFPSFAISRACFDLVDGKYVLKGDVSGDMGAFTPFGGEIGKLTIEITDDSYIFTDTSEDSKTVVTFSEIGTADVGYTISDVKEPASEGKWTELLSSDMLYNLTSIFGAGKEDTLPVPSGFNYEGWVDFGEEGIAMLLFYADSPVPTEADVTNYGKQLEAAGFVDTGEIDEYTYGLKIFMSADQTIGVEIGIVSGAELGGADQPYFCIVVGTL